MNSAKQTAMDAFNITSWPNGHVRSQEAAGCRGYACKLMRMKGMSNKQIAHEVGFQSVEYVSQAIKKFTSVYGSTTPRVKDDIDWANITIRKKEVKNIIRIGIDVDVLEYFKAGGKGYYTRMNDVLYSYMIAQKEDRA